MLEVSREMVAVKTTEKERITTLVVEDDRNFRLMLQETLNDLNGLVVTKSFANDVKTAMQKFMEVKPDIVLLDINLPDGKGLDLIEPMLRIHPAVSIVMVTGSRVNADVERAKRDGAIGYILKPYTRKKINDVFQLCLQYRAQYAAQQMDEKSETENTIFIQTPLDFFVADEEEEKKSPVETVLSQWNILFADGYLTNIESAERHLLSLCKRLDVASTAEQCEQLLNSQEYHCILIDPTLPGGDGYLITYNLKLRYRDRPIKPFILALMPNKDELDKKKWLQAGMNDFLIKPCSFKDITDKLRKFAQSYIKASGDRYFT